MSTREFHFSEGTSNKFWRITVDGTTHTVQYGKLGTEGQSQVKQFASDAEAEASANKLIAEKTKKGYVEAETGGVPSTPAAPDGGGSGEDGVSLFMKKFGRGKPVGETDKSIGSFEQKVGWTLPVSVQQFFKTYGGERQLKSNFHFWSLEESEKWVPYEPERFGGFGLVPIFDRNNSNPFCVACTGPLTGYIVHVFHDDKNYLRFRSIDELFAAFAKATSSQRDDDDVPFDSFTKPRARTLEDVAAARLLLKEAQETEVDDHTAYRYEFSLKLLPEDSVDEFATLLDNEDSDLQHQARERLQQIGTPEAKQVLNAYLDRRLVVYAAIVDALDIDNFTIDNTLASPKLDGPSGFVFPLHRAYVTYSDRHRSGNVAAVVKDVKVGLEKHYDRIALKERYANDVAEAIVKEGFSAEVVGEGNSFGVLVNDEWDPHYVDRWNIKDDGREEAIAEIVSNILKLSRQLAEMEGKRLSANGGIKKVKCRDNREFGAPYDPNLEFRMGMEFHDVDNRKVTNYSWADLAGVWHEWGGNGTHEYEADGTYIRTLGGSSRSSKVKLKGDELYLAKDAKFIVHIAGNTMTLYNDGRVWLRASRGAGDGDPFGTPRQQEGTYYPPDFHNVNGRVPQSYSPSDLAGEWVSLQLKSRQGGTHEFDVDSGYIYTAEGRRHYGAYKIDGDRLSTLVEVDGETETNSLLIKIDDDRLTLCLDDGYVYDRWGRPNSEAAVAVRAAAEKERREKDAADRKMKAVSARMQDRVSTRQEFTQRSAGESVRAAARTSYSIDDIAGQWKHVGSSSLLMRDLESQPLIKSELGDLVLTTGGAYSFTTDLGVNQGTITLDEDCLTFTPRDNPDARTFTVRIQLRDASTMHIYDLVVYGDGWLLAKFTRGF